MIFKRTRSVFANRSTRLLIVAFLFTITTMTVAAMTGNISLYSDIHLTDSHSDESQSQDSADKTISDDSAFQFTTNDEGSYHGIRVQVKDDIESSETTEPHVVRSEHRVFMSGVSKILKLKVDRTKFALADEVLNRLANESDMNRRILEVVNIDFPQFTEDDLSESMLTELSTESDRPLLVSYKCSATHHRRAASVELVDKCLDAVKQIIESPAIEIASVTTHIFQRRPSRGLLDILIPSRTSDPLDALVRKKWAEQLEKEK